MTPLDLLLAHAAATWALVGLIWIVQLVQYPGFARVGPRELGEFHEHHSARITLVVGPLMAVEGLSAALLLETPPAGVSTELLWAGLGLVGLNALATAFVAVPLHRRLRPGAIAVQRRLVRTNWIRTVAWTARGVLVLEALRQFHGG